MLGEKCFQHVFKHFGNHRGNRDSPVITDFTRVPSSILDDGYDSPKPKLTWYIGMRQHEVEQRSQFDEKH